MLPEAPLWHVRIRGSDDSAVVGAGVLVDSRRIITCAHVVTKALGLSTGVRECPVKPVVIDFPQSEQNERRNARVISGGWFPEGSSADLAVLEVDGDELVWALPAPLRPAGDHERTIFAFGHPTGHDNGTWARARLIAFGGENPNWVQLESLSHTGKRIQKGYSGAGVWDQRTNAVIGWVVAADREESDRVGWMIPVEFAVRHWRELQGLLQQEPQQEQRKWTASQPQGKPRTVVMPSEDEQWVISIADRLVEMLGGISVVQHANGRALLVEAMESRFAGRLKVDRPDGDYEIADLIEICLEHPGALHDLVRLLRDHCATEPEQRLVGNISKLVDKTIDPDPLLLTSERNKLYSLLGILREHITTDMVLRCHREAARSWSYLSIDPRDLYSIVRSLESATWNSDELPPLVHFLELLCLVMPPVSPISDVRAWVDELSSRQGFHRHVIYRLRLSSPPPPLQRTTGYVTTELSHFGAKERYYLTSITLRACDTLDQVVYEQNLHSDDKELTVTQIPALFDSVLFGAWSAATAQMDELVMEFVLPIELLDHAVDQWTIKDVVAHPVCSEHHVRVRSKDRIENWASHRHWRQKTAVLQSGQVIPRWIYPHEEENPSRLFNELILEDTACLVLTRPPTLGPLLGNDAVSIGIRTGVPVIIWCRDEGSIESFTERLRDYLAHNNNNAAKLYDFVRKLRTDNIIFGDPPGAHITLIWDPADGSSSTTIRHQAPRP